MRRLQAPVAEAPVEAPVAEAPAEEAPVVAELKKLDATGWVVALVSCSSDCSAVLVYLKKEIKRFSSFIFYLRKRVVLKSD